MYIKARIRPYMNVTSRRAWAHGLISAYIVHTPNEQGCLSTHFGGVAAFLKRQSCHNTIHHITEQGCLSTHFGGVAAFIKRAILPQISSRSSSAAKMMVLSERVPRMMPLGRVMGWFSRSSVFTSRTGTTTHTSPAI